MEEQAVQYNPNLYTALQRVEEARALTGVSKADLYPQLNLNPSLTNSVYLFELYGLSGIPLPTKIPLELRVHAPQYSLPFTVNYELDLWGKLRSQYESALFNAEAQVWAYYTSLLTLTTDLANSYFILRSLDSQIDLLEKTVKDRRTNLALNQSRYSKGLGNLVDVTQAQLDLKNTESTYIDTVRQRNVQENVIATLIGIPASDFTLEHSPLRDDPPAIPAGIPSEVMLQRPDIAQAERAMASEHKLINSAYASLYPSLSLTATYGYLSPLLKDFPGKKPLLVLCHQYYANPI